MMVYLLAANRGSNCSFTRAMDGRIVRCGIVSSCQSAATSEIVKAFLVTSSSHVRSAITSTGLYFTFTSYYYYYYYYYYYLHLVSDKNDSFSSFHGQVDQTTVKQLSADMYVHGTQRVVK